MRLIRISCLLIVLTLLFPGTRSATAAPAIAPAASYQLVSYTIDGGGQMRSSGGERFQLSGTMGQADSSVQTVAERYTLNGGFWQAAARGTEANQIFLPLIRR